MTRELPRQLVGAVLRADEDEREPALGAEVLDERVELPLVRDRDEGVLDVCLAVLGRPLGAEPRGVVGVPLGDSGDCPLERRGEQHRLPVARHAAEDAVDLRLEAHVEHAVGLVQHEHADRVERHEAALEQVVEPSRRRDEDVGRACELRLCAHGGAAVDDGDAEALRRRERPQVGRDLDRELTGRDEDECRRPAALDGRALDERQAEGERLARPGRRLGEDVKTRERVRQDELLDRERAMDVLRAECAHNGRADAERLEVL